MSWISPTTLEQWIHRAFELNQTYYDLIGIGEGQQLGPPAPMNEIAAFEAWLGYQLPPSYRLFLSLHNGWRDWEGDTDLLSIDEMRQGPYQDWIRVLKNEAWTEGDSVLLEGLVIGATPNSPSCFILDISKLDERGEMEIVNWEHSEVARYSDFLDMLQRTAEDLRKMIAEESAEQSAEWPTEES